MSIAQVFILIEKVFILVVQVQIKNWTHHLSIFYTFLEVDFFFRSIQPIFLTICEEFCKSKTTNIFYTILSFKWDPWWHTFELSVAQVFKSRHASIHPSSRKYSSSSCKCKYKNWTHHSSIFYTFLDVIFSSLFNLNNISDDLWEILQI